MSGSNISAWTIGSTLLDFGLSPQQAIASVIVGGIFTGILAVLCGWIGAKHHIGFTVASRFSWGMVGSYSPVILRVFVASIWFGMQAFWGGQATRVCLGAVFTGLANMPNSFSPSSHLETKDFIGLLIWMCAFSPAILIRPERLQIPFAVCFVLFCSTIFGLLIWGVTQAHGPGIMFGQPDTSPNTGWAFMFSLTAIMGSWGGGTLGHSAPVPSQLITSPLSIALTAVIGIVVTSAAQRILGKVIWNPIYLLAAMQDHYDSNSAVRVGVFFAGLGLVASQLAVRFSNMVDKSCRGIMLADYHVVRGRKLKVDHLYRGDESSMYWFTGGVNWRAPVAFALGAWPMLPGLVASVDALHDKTWAGWVRLFNLTFMVGLAIGFTVFLCLSLAFPPAALGSGADWGDTESCTDAYNGASVGIGPCQTEACLVSTCTL